MGCKKENCGCAATTEIENKATTNGLTSLNTYSSDELENNLWFDFEEAYFKVVAEEMRVDFGKNVIKIPVRGYASKAARENDANGIFKRVYSVAIPTDGSLNLTSRDEITAFTYTELAKVPFFKSGNAV